jgi:hypothetical protein
MSASLELHPQSKRNKPTPKPSAPLTPAPMSRISQSAELDDYTASMRQYLATVEQTQSRRKDSESSRGGDRRSEIVSGRDREKSPEFRWMDLDNLRKEHGHTTGGIPNGIEALIAKNASKAGGHHHHHNGKDPRSPHRDHRSGSPAGKAMASKRLPVHAGVKLPEKN